MALWYWSVGDYGETVAVFEDTPGGILRIRIHDPARRRPRKRSLRHRDKEKAKNEALEAYKLLREGKRRLAGPLTLGELVALFLEDRPAGRRESRHGIEEARRLAMWLRYLRPGTIVESIGNQQLGPFQDERASGTIDATGARVPAGQREPVGPRTVEADIVALKHVMNWGTRQRGAHGFLLHQNPLRSYEIDEKRILRAIPDPEVRERYRKPYRPVATYGYFQKVRAVSDQVMMEVRWFRSTNPRRKKKLGRTLVRSYLSEMLDLNEEGGRRENAICSLQLSDFDMRPVRIDAENPPNSDYGSITWRGEYDKNGHPSITFMTPVQRAAVERIFRDRKAVGNVPAFPSPGNKSQPVSYRYAHTLLRRACKLAGVPFLGWHAFRRKKYIELKGHDVGTVMDFMGVKDQRTVLRNYQMADPASLRKIANDTTKLEEMWGS